MRWEQVRWGQVRPVPVRNIGPMKFAGYIFHLPFDPLAPFNFPLAPCGPDCPPPLFPNCPRTLRAFSFQSTAQALSFPRAPLTLSSCNEAEAGKRRARRNSSILYYSTSFFARAIHGMVVGRSPKLSLIERARGVEHER